MARCPIDNPTTAAHLPEQLCRSATPLQALSRDRVPVPPPKRSKIGVFSPPIARDCRSLTARARTVAIASIENTTIGARVRAVKSKRPASAVSSTLMKIAGAEPDGAIRTIDAAQLAGRTYPAG